MSLRLSDVAIFLAFFAVVVGLGLAKSRRRREAEDYFLAGRGLTWPLIGLSIVAANISTEQFVGMAGQGAGDVGLAVSAWQLTGAIGIVLIAFTLLPRFLRAGIYTMPEYLEFRYDPAARAIMAVYTVVIYATVTISAVLYSGGLTLATIFDLDLETAIWIVGGIATLYTAWGGLTAVAWADLLQGGALLAGGAATLVLVVRASGGIGDFVAASADRLHMVLPAEHPTLPWTGVVLGMWIPIVYYCGLNQFIVQRTLAARSLRHGQLGIVFAAALWLLVPLVIVLPGLGARQLFAPELAAAADADNAPVLAELQAARESGAPVLFVADDEWRAREPVRAAEVDAHNARVRAGLGDAAPAATRRLVGSKPDAAYPVLVRRLISPGLRGLLLAALAGAVISSLASMLNSAATIFTMDLVGRHLRPAASPRGLVTLGRVATVVFVVAGCLLAPALARPQFKGVFNFIQEFQGYVSPGIVAAFLVGTLVPRAPARAGAVALLASAPIYGLLHLFAGGTRWSAVEVHFLIRMLATFLAVAGIMLAMTAYRPLPAPRVMPVRADLDARSSPLAAILGAAVVAGALAYFVVFW
ncbi:MAG: sodium/solute symporter [Planctomycetota bacterium]